MNDAPLVADPVVADHAADPARVLLVEDDAGVRQVIRRVLARAGLQVVEAPSGDAAAALMEADKGFDMLVTDVRMPGTCDGVSLALDWRQQVPGRPVLFVSGYDDNRLAAASLAPCRR